jgi:hypothetical protein
MDLLGAFNSLYAISKAPVRTAGNQRVVVCASGCMHNPLARYRTAPRFTFTIFNSGHPLHTNCYHFTDP